MLAGDEVEMQAFVAKDPQANTSVIKVCDIANHTITSDATRVVVRDSKV